MITANVLVKNDTGLHARPASLLVRKASQYKSNISIQLGEKVANGKSLISVLALGAKNGSNLEIKASGIDETKALEEIIKFVSELEE